MASPAGRRSVAGQRPGGGPRRATLAVASGGPGRRWPAGPFAPPGGRAVGGAARDGTGGGTWRGVSACRDRGGPGGRPAVSVTFDVVWSVGLIGAARAVGSRVLAVRVRLATALLAALAGVTVGAVVQAAVAGGWKGAAPGALFACSSAFAALAVVSVLSLLGGAPNVEFGAEPASLGPPRSPWRAGRDFLARYRRYGQLVWLRSEERRVGEAGR